MPTTPIEKEQKIRHDCELALSFGANRETKHWKNRRMTWSALCERLAHPTVTQERYNEFMAMTREDRQRIKDVGGFVGGVLLKGRRKADSVKWRSMVTLDMDNPKGDAWASVQKAFKGFALAVYSTHSHAELKQRIRILIPLSRNVTADEYQPLARGLADELGLDQFDDTTYQPERLMFWPSVARDGVYIHHVQDAPLLNPDRVLRDKYFDWTDVSEWPTSSRERDVVLRSQKQQGDPLEKPGPVGLFCRTYDIPTAIEKFLSDVYAPADDGRYTYIPGSSVGGLVIYEDEAQQPVFAYSHHGTDPCSGRLVNAFDLVRLHKFGAEDFEAARDTAVNKLPSYQHMARFMQKDPEIKEQIISDRESAVAMFDDLGDAPDEEAPKKKEDRRWLRKLTVNQNNRIESSAHNIRVVLENDPNFKDALGKDLFGQRMMTLRAMPWDTENAGMRYWGNTDDACLRTYLEERFGIRGKDRIADVLTDVMQAHSFHPVRDYLSGLKWDGKKRLDELFIRTLGVPDSEYARTVTRKAFTAAVARVMQPGIKYETLIVLVGPQGAGKSLLLRRMARRWFTDSLQTIQGKEAMEALQGAWIVEIGEMAATRRAENDAIKAYIAKQDDSFRPAYGHHKETYPRQCVFFGTTNTHFFLRDTTGNRRFWPLETTAPASKTIRRVTGMRESTIDQLWAEAKHYYEAGEPLFLDERLASAARDVQKDFLEVSPIASQIEDFVNRKVPADWAKKSLADRRSWLDAAEYDMASDEDLVPRDRISAIEVWCECLGNPLARFQRPDSREINDVLENIPGWERARKTLRVGPSYGVQRGFIRRGGSKC